ncbi:YiiX family permuted papain-like enzyme [Chitinophaga niabensis]|uniref:Permuted papain-like amidase enzyme, YaeF/YiiX, C92 family n=1 Tax=Chitinophaga niabensis TaxID=536979 RepID=A0A1N6JQE6_9BACT|nr:YiiX family permuted papain-like enzyme [Chitinophaga niabensis]SIO46377.1 Permuted papain-like amidase enzyme, YaeF/YiiX, C92 family [Chitinophaga niabensis]
MLAIRLFLLLCLAQNKELAEGDIIFQSNISPQCKAIELATHSKYSHCGILFKKGQDWYVWEAVQPVMQTRLEEWTLRGNKHFVVKRLIADSLITTAVIKKMQDAGSKYMGKNYDSYFEWSDDRIYCSELVWKIYKETMDIEVGKRNPLRSYDLSHPLVKATLKERYGKNIPLEEMMVSPGDIFESPLLKTVVSQ